MNIGNTEVEITFDQPAAEREVRTMFDKIIKSPKLVRMTDENIEKMKKIIMQIICSHVSIKI